ncbi:MAG: NAD-dependent malic enzyme [Dehalococcoidia bacterium]|jgi:malate dehydrogenase (oxaloacetate-decarboxylating)|nr:NAD-dependent malic enzyme [Tepidiformaceae bacterium]
MSRESTRQRPAPAYTFTFQAQYPDQPGMLARIAAAVAEAGGSMGEIDVVRSTPRWILREFHVSAHDGEHARQVLASVRRLRGVSIKAATDRVFRSHRGGKIEVHNRVPVATLSDLSTVYTPGVARVCLAIEREPEAAYELTTKGNSVAVVTDGTAVLGLGDIGPAAAMPVMEGKAMLFKAFGGIDAWPICLDTRDPDQIVATVKALAPGFGGINLEDISAPRCFEIEDRLRAELDIPVFHDDQHGTAVVVLAALINALRLVKKEPPDLKVVVLGAGAAGIACSRIIMAAGVTNIIGCDRSGIIYKGRAEHMNAMKEWFAAHTNPEGRRGSISDALEGADLLLGLAGPDLVTVDDIKRMNRDPMVFAMANPDPEIRPELAAPHVAIMATGRSDFPNQINNVLCFPGLFRGVLDVRARQINEEMKLAAAYAIADSVSKSELSAEYIIPSVFHPTVFKNVARAVARKAIETGVASHPAKASRHVFI